MKEGLQSSSLWKEAALCDACFFSSHSTDKLFEQTFFCPHGAFPEVVRVDVTDEPLPVAENDDDDEGDRPSSPCLCVISPPLCLRFCVTRLLMNRLVWTGPGLSDPLQSSLCFNLSDDRLPSFGRTSGELCRSLCSSESEPYRSRVSI